MSGTTSPPAPLGAKTAPVLMTIFQDAYRQELGAEEDVHRTLPFFATALGFVIGAINYTVGQLPGLDSVTGTLASSRGGLLNHHVLARAWPVIVATLLLVLAALLGVGVLAFLAAATRRLSYKRAGPETDQLSRARALHDYHAQLGLAGDRLDEAVSLDLREQLLSDYAHVIPFNRRLTLRCYTYRARAVSCLLLSLLFALLATMLVLATAKTGFLAKA